MSGRHAWQAALYAEDFDAPDPVVVPEPEEESAADLAEPVFGTADLAAARDEGRAAGLAESANSLAATRVALLREIEAGVRAGRDESRDAAELAAEAVARTMLSALAACLPALCAQHGERELRALARALLPSLVEEPRISLRVNPLMVPGLQEEVAALEPGVASAVELVPVAEMPPGDIRVAWQDGGAVRNASQARAAVEDALAAMGLLEREMMDV